jgi:FAD/FMN-containing dehydrogenase/Fe-S oxidoreductase
VNGPNEVTGGSLQARALAAELRKVVRGEVRFDDGARALYATDASNYRQVPIGVVVPRNADDVRAAVAVCRKFDAPILARGGGTSLAGQCCNVAVVFDFTKYMHHVIEIDAAARRARVQPGVVLDQLNAAAEPHSLMYGPDPATHNHCTLGGMIGNNSCGVHSVMAGRTVDNVEELVVLTYDGLELRVGETDAIEYDRRLAAGKREATIYRQLRALAERAAPLVRARYPRIPRRVSGYNLDELLPEHGFHVARALTGTEGTCVLVLEATVRLVQRPRARSLLVLGYPSVYEAADHVTEVMQSGCIGLEGIDDVLIGDIQTKGLHANYLSLLPDGRGFLLVEFGGDTKADSDAQAEALMARLRARPGAPSMKLYDDADEEKHIWKVRESGLGATARIRGKPDTWEGWEDSAVPPERLGEYLRKLRGLFDRYHYDCALYGHFGQGCVHTRINFDLKTAPGIATFRAFLDDASDLVLSLGGSLSGEHGDGQSRADLLPKMFGPELIDAFREFKRIWDPDGRMNPGKVVDAYHVTQNLRLGEDYRPRTPPTYFTFPDDHGSFAYATERCVGVGECRRLDGGVMCPSYRVTRDEQHSTRGRAHLLFELFRGDVLARDWRDHHVKEALDLCLACKGCKSDCPVNVDVATYKAEFLAHYYKRRLRPIAAYTMGLIYWWARLASHMPRLVNWLAHAPLFGRVFKALGGIHREREVPRFARWTFRRWFAARALANEGRPQVMLWPDTFTNYFQPGIAAAAVDVLESAGYQVVLPPRVLCCGRPLYDFGMLGLARRMLRQILDSLRDEIARGTPLVALEPSCLSVFRDELVALFPSDEHAQRLARQSFLLSEFLRDQARWHPPTLPAAKALVQAHCHHHAIAKLDAERALLDEMGMQHAILDAGCCGMAGAFGFERAHYDVSVACAEHKLLPAVRDASLDTLVVADGFSCREQIAQTTGRRALHLAQLLQMALHKHAPPPTLDATRRAPSPHHVGWLALAPVLAVLLALFLLFH